MRKDVSRRPAGLVPVVVLAALLPACGGSDGPTPVPSASPRTTTTLYNQAFTIEPSLGPGTPSAQAVDVNIPNAGDVTVIVDWTNPSSDLDLVISNTTCTSGIAAWLGSCTVHGIDRGASKPARVSVPGASPGFIRIWVLNFAEIRESGVITVTLTR